MNFSELAATDVIREADFQFRNLVMSAPSPIAPAPLSGGTLDVPAHKVHAAALRKDGMTTIPDFVAPDRLAALRAAIEDAFADNRPLWTHLVQNQNTDVVMAFYATNVETFSTRPDHPKPIHAGYPGMTWPYYAVWDETQAEFLRRAGQSEARMTMVGPIGFMDSGADLPDLPRPFVAVFDVAAQRPTSMAARGIVHPYFEAAVVIRFMTDIADALADLDLHLVIKQKRALGAQLSRHYDAFSRSLAARTSMTAIEPAISAHRLIADAGAVISFPFSSAALIARALGRPSAFYDPLSAFEPNERLAHGIPILSGPAELVAWLSQVVPGEMPSPAPRIAEG